MLLLGNRSRANRSACGCRSLNTAFKYAEDTVQRVRGLTEETRNLSEKLQAARSNNRFLDKRLADVEPPLVDAVRS